MNSQSSIIINNWDIIIRRVLAEINCLLSLQVQITSDMMNLSILLGVPGYWQIILIVLVVLLLFGGKKIPELMKGIGRGTREFKKGLNTDEEDEDGGKDVAKKE
jgi:sec-independent protein translocase protein TatA